MQQEKQKLSIRRATQQDAETIAAIMRCAFEKYSVDSHLNADISLEGLTESVETIREEIAAKYVLIATLGEQAVGSVRIALLGNGEAYLSRFGVISKYRAIGIGKELMNRVDRLMGEHGVTQLFLHTASKNGPLIRFYYKCGFYVDEVRKDKGYPRATMIKEYT